jgi:hypothetical protein
MIRYVGLASALLVVPVAVCAQWAENQLWPDNVLFDAASAATVAVTYAGAVDDGDLLVCGVKGNDGQTIDSVSDNLNTMPTEWTQVTSSPQSHPATRRLSMWYYEGSTSGTPTVTATYSAATGSRGIFCASYSGIQTSGAFDVSAGQTQLNAGTGAGDANTGDTSATSEDNSLAVAMMIVDPLTTATVGSGWTERINTNGSNNTVHVEHQNVASPGVVRGTWTVNDAGDDVASIVAVFQEEAAAPGGPPLGSLLLLGVGR